MTKIEWTDQTWNPVFGCTKVSPGCANCYAERMAHRLANIAYADKDNYRNPGVKESYQRVVTPNRGHWNGRIVCDEDVLLKPLSWRKPRTIFVCSMSDLFHEDVPVAFIDKVWAVMALCPQHTFQVLTKRPERMAEYLACTGKSIEFLETPARAIGYTLKFEGMGLRPWPLPSIWLGTSCEDQQRAGERIPHLIQCPAAVRFLSLEPLLGPLKLAVRGVDQLIIGGESGHGARPCDVEWIRDIVQQGKAAGVAVFVKQLGGYPDKRNNMADWPEDLRVREFPTVEARSER